MILGSSNRSYQHWFRYYQRIVYNHQWSWRVSLYLGSYPIIRMIWRYPNQSWKIWGIWDSLISYVISSRGRTMQNRSWSTSRHLWSTLMIPVGKYRLVSYSIYNRMPRIVSFSLCNTLSMKCSRISNYQRVLMWNVGIHTLLRSWTTKSMHVYMCLNCSDLVVKIISYRCRTSYVINPIPSSQWISYCTLLTYLRSMWV